jgi:hypothetical protein
MPEDNEKDNGSKAANRLKDRPDKKPDLHDYKSEDKDVIGETLKEEEGEQLQETDDEEELQDEHESETPNDGSLPPGA